MPKSAFPDVYAASAEDIFTHILREALRLLVLLRRACEGLKA